MSGNENVLRPSADLAREKTEASIKAAQKNAKTKGDDRSKYVENNCDAVNNMVSFENEVHNVSPNATNISR